MQFFDYSFSFLGAHDMWMLSTALLCSLFLMDDLFIDLVAFIKQKKAKKISDKEFEQMNSIPERKIGIMVANWHEDQVLERMIAGNINNIDYSNYEFFIGVYPNDQQTLEAARRAEKRFKNVTVVVNNLDGPTSKGQMLNLIISYINAYNKENQSKAIEIVLMHDAEDVIHKNALKLINLKNLEYDFIQIPVFSLNVPVSKLTAGIYIDEFIEAHTKDLLVRNYFNAGVPSAGVGTAISWSVVKMLLNLNDGKFLNEKTLTEDYYLGLTCHDLNVKSHFACEFYEYHNKETDKKIVEYIATRAYFPQKVGQSIRQKTRWSLGISLQGFELRKTKAAHFFESYFLWRDRKGLPSAPLFTSAFIFTAFFIFTYITTGDWPRLHYAPYGQAFEMMMWFNLLFSVFRVIQRFVMVKKVYGFSLAMLVPIRWILSNFINTASTYNAIYQWTKAKIKGELPAWSKTEHIIPAGFGLENASLIEDGVPATNQLNSENNNIN